jgi:carboxyl-terminal processing protease
MIRFWAKICSVVVGLCIGVQAFAFVFNTERDGRITQMVAEILRQYHYLHRPIDDEISKTHLKNYVDSLDYFHLMFLQSDLDEFSKKYGGKLDEFSLKGDAGPAIEIYQCFIKRLESRVQLIEKLLKEKYDFSTDETILLNR